MILKYILFMMLLTSFNAHASKIKRGFEALDVFNYFEAKRLFESSTKKHPAPSYYGLSIIYARTDNPFSNLDSAHAMIQRSLKTFGEAKGRTKQGYFKVGVDSSRILSQRKQISRLYYNRAIEVHSVYGYQDFIAQNSWSADIDSAIVKRDRLAFEQAVRLGGSKDFDDYLKAYPQSQMSNEVTALYHKSLYAENTFSNNFIDYVNFVNQHPESPYHQDAEDKVYQLSTTTATVQAYRNFIVEYPANHNVKDAWKHLYNAKIKENYSSEAILEFSEEYPDYPYKTDLLKEYNMADKIFFPVKSEGKWGFLDKSSGVLINNQFELVEWFSEGYAVVKQDGKFGYINKLGEIVIKLQFDDALRFHKGFALVEVDELLGMIDRNGEYIITPEYEDLGVLKDGLCYFEKDELFGYFDEKGIVRLAAQYTEAYDFQDGLAVVSKNDYYGLIDEYGTTLFPFKYESLKPFDSGEYLIEVNAYFGVISIDGDTIIPVKYDYIGRWKNGYSIVELEDEFNFVDSTGLPIFENWMATYPEYKLLAPFENGYCKVKFEKGYNLVSPLGVSLLKRDVEDIGSYGELIAFSKNQKWGYINPKGQVLIEPVFDFAQAFLDGNAIVRIAPFYGLINNKGEYVVQPYQEDIRQISDSIFLFKNLGKYGLIDALGDTLLAPKYKNIEPIEDKVVKIEEGTALYYYLIKEKQFIRREE
jgi:hypothetical protein